MFTYCMSKYYLNQYSLKLPEQTGKQCNLQTSRMFNVHKNVVLYLFPLIFQINECIKIRSGVRQFTRGTGSLCLKTRFAPCLLRHDTVGSCSQTYQVPR